ncbi:hypothetical protein KY284_012911 [Solanum tuberosum]|nr:hypothetical protein KY284_012911 [Solanum tuberosum]
MQSIGLNFVLFGKYSCQVHTNPAKKWLRRAIRNIPEVGMSHSHLQFHWGKPGGSGLRDSLAREFPQILRQIRELGMEFIFTESTECNLHMVREIFTPIGCPRHDSTK